MRSIRQCLLIAFAIAVLAPPAESADAAVEVVKRPAKIIRRTFDPQNPPKEMPPLTPPEAALCQGESHIEARVGGETTSGNDGFASLKVNKIEIELKLTITVWTPKDAPKAIIDHEEAHRRIYEHYYRTADAVARNVAKPYIGEQSELTTRDLDRRVDEVLSKITKEIMAKYNAAIPVEDAQKRFDVITDHSRKDVPVEEAMKQAIAEAKAAKPG